MAYNKPIQRGFDHQDNLSIFTFWDFPFDDLLAGSFITITDSSNIHVILSFDSINNTIKVNGMLAGVHIVDVDTNQQNSLQAVFEVLKGWGFDTNNNVSFRKTPSSLSA